MATNLHEAIVHAAGDGIVLAGRDGKILEWNAAATRIFGFTREQALGQTLDLIIPERYRERHWTAYDVTMETGITRYGSDLLRIPALHAEGRPLSIAMTVGLLTDDAGQVSSIVAVVRDDTQRFQEERALRTRIKELEAATTA